MKEYRVIFAQEAEDALVDIFHYISSRSSMEIAERFTDGIIKRCNDLHVMPMVGTRRDDIRPGLRITNYKGRVTIAFSVVGDCVYILGIFYGGQNYEVYLKSQGSSENS